EVSTPLTTDYVNLITLRSQQHSIAGTLVGLRGEPRLVMIDDHKVDVPPARHMLIVRNDDRPGMIGLVGTALGDAGINIADMDVGQSPRGTALMLIATPDAVPSTLLERLRSAPGILSVHSLTS